MCWPVRDSYAAITLGGGPAVNEETTMNTCPRCGATLNDDTWHPIGTCGEVDAPGAIHFDGDTMAPDKRADVIRRFMAAEWVRAIDEGLLDDILLVEGV
jgi:hypothetical protein